MTCGRTTGNYNSYLGFNPETGTAVVVLSNLAPNYRVPATVLGVKLLLELDNEKRSFQSCGETNPNLKQKKNSVS